MIREYQLGINGKKVNATMDIRADNSGGILALSGKKYQVKFSRLDDHSWHIECGGNCCQAYVLKKNDYTHISVNGQVYVIGDPGKKKPSRSRTGGPGKGADVVTPPTPAAVERILVQTGQAVEEGQSLIVVSAMKMEMTLAAPYAGMVARVNSKEGDQVAPGDILVEITANESNTAQDPTINDVQNN